MIKSQKSKFNPNDFKSIHSREFCFIDDVKVYAVVSSGVMAWVYGQLVVEAVTYYESGETYLLWGVAAFALLVVIAGFALGAIKRAKELKITKKSSVK